jgi:hypothetical protein
LFLGGLEVAQIRLLKLIDKGVTVEQVAKVTRNFTEAGMVHCYLMYGYQSTQTVQETGQSGDGASIVSGYCSQGFGINLP